MTERGEKKGGERGEKKGPREDADERGDPHRDAGLRAVRDLALALAAGVVPVAQEQGVVVSVRRPLFSVLPLGEMLRRTPERRRQALMEYHAQLAVRNRRKALSDERAVKAFERLAEAGYERAAQVLAERGVPPEAVVETHAGGVEAVKAFQERTYPRFARAEWREDVEALWTAMAVANVCMLAGVPEDGKALKDAVRDVERASLFFGMTSGDTGDTGDRREAGETEARMPEDVERTGYARYRLGRERAFERDVDGRHGAEAAFALAGLLARSGREWT